ncbi:hypothetical protein [Enterococcus avium]|uniref:hypothetical protein n=1 Tax=Enterococcus avium TaxID=33945 RepID=UPI0034A461A6
MNLFVIDIGGSTIKYATWDGEQLDAKKKFAYTEFLGSDEGAVHCGVEKLNT